MNRIHFISIKCINKLNVEEWIILNHHSVIWFGKTCLFSKVFLYYQHCHISVCLSQKLYSLKSSTHIFLDFTSKILGNGNIDKNSRWSWISAFFSQTTFGTQWYFLAIMIAERNSTYHFPPLSSNNMKFGGEILTAFSVWVTTSQTYCSHCSITYARITT